MLENIFTLYSSSPLIAAVSEAVCKFNGRYMPCSEALGFLGPIIVALTPFFMAFVFFAFVALVVHIVSWWKVFEKAGRPGWTAIVPIYSTIVMLQIVGMSPWLVLLMFIPGVGSIAFFVVKIFANINLAKAFGKSEGFVVGLIFLPIVFVPILAFDNSRYFGIAPVVPGSVPPNPPPAPPAPTPTV